MATSGQYPMTIGIPLCSHCAHFRKKVGVPTCDAYPEGIPGEIITSEVDHRKPYQGDHGIRYEPEEGARFTVQFAFKRHQLRAPKGSPYGGRWIDEPDSFIGGTEQIKQPIEPTSARVAASSNAFMESRNVTQEVLTQRIQELYAKATPEQLQRREWYYQARDLAQMWADEYGVPMWRVAAILSAVSPQNSWDDEYDPQTLTGSKALSNQVVARSILDLVYNPDFYTKPYTITAEAAAEYERRQRNEYQAAVEAAAAAGKDKPRSRKIWSWAKYNGVDPAFEEGKSFVGTFKGEDLPADILVTLEQDHINYMGTNSIKAVRMARGADPADVLGGPKTRSFYNNIHDPENSLDATIDVHMARALLNRLDLSDKELAEMVGKPARYQVFDRAMKAEAARLGLKPHELQAIVWYVWRDDPANASSVRAQITKKRKKEEANAKAA